MPRILSVSWIANDVKHIGGPIYAMQDVIPAAAFIGCPYEYFFIVQDEHYELIKTALEWARRRRSEMAAQILDAD